MTTDTPDRLLTRIRGLLNQAEHPNTSPEEAQAFTAKAARLMAQYGIDRAMLAAADPTTDVPGDRIVVIAGRYALDKQGLLSAVGESLGCRTVLRTGWVDGAKQRQVHLFGYGSDLERVEMLYTSLLVQAANGMAKAEVPYWENAAAFRRSWLAGFTWAIVARLRDAETRAQDHAQRERAASAGPSVAVVLADRAALVQARLAQAYPKLGRSKPRTLSGSGYRDGHHAGQRADLDQPSLTHTDRRELHARRTDAGR